MAYIGKDKVAQVRNRLKAKFPVKEGYKFSVKMINRGDGVKVTIMSAPLQLAFGSVNYTVNFYHIGEIPPQHLTFFNEIRKIIFSVCGDYTDDSDIMTDYFDISYYYDVCVGAYDKPFVCTNAVKFDLAVDAARNLAVGDQTRVEYDGNSFGFARFDNRQTTIFYDHNQCKVYSNADQNQFRFAAYKLWLMSVAKRNGIVAMEPTTTINTSNPSVPKVTISF